MFTDSHAHVLSEYYSDIESLLNDAKNNNISRIINCGYDLKSSQEVLLLSKQHENIYGALGIHPEEVEKYCDNDITFIEENLSAKKVIAIGEIGLDYYYTKDNKEEQIKLFEKQLAVAEKYNVPVIVHSREATLDTINILKKYKVRGIIHSFSGSYETAMEYIKMGYLIGINGIITFNNSKIKDTIKRLPLDSIVLETDSPYLTPVPYRGKQNAPKYIYNIAVFVANLFEIELNELAKITNDNLSRVFDKMS